MSDDTNQTNDDLAKGGWSAPSKPGTWHTPQKTTSQEGWRVPTLPKDLDQQPESAGGWHLPAPDDTVFTDEDEVEIPTSQEALDDLIDEAQSTIDADAKAQATSGRILAPEDQLLALVNAATELDDVDIEEPKSPEDLLALLDTIEDDDDVGGSTAGMRNELFALASLVEDQIASDSERIGAFDVTEEDEDEEDGISAYTTAEDVIAGEYETDDPGAYARQMLAELEGDDEDEDYGAEEDAVAMGGVSGADDPGAYARQMLAELEGGESVTDQYDTPLPQDTEVIDPRQEELARRFREVEEDVARMRQMVANGQMTEDELRAQIQNMMILDDDQIWWTIGEDTNQWYKYVNDEWQVAEPPRASSSTLQFQTNQYLDDDRGVAGTQAGATQAGVADNIRLDENFMPLPRDVPTTDPNATLVGESYLSDLRGAGTETIEHMPGDTVPTEAQPIDYGNYAETVPAQQGYSGGTMQYEPVYGAQEASVQSAIDTSEPPDLSDQYETPIADDVYESRQRNLIRTLVFAGLTLFAIVLLIGAGGVFLATQWYNGIVDRFEPQIAGLQNYSPPFQSITLLDYRGEPFATISRDGQEQISISLNEMSPDLIHAVISIKNPTYFTDPGWEIVNTINGFLQNLTGGAPALTDKTITQTIAEELVLQVSEQNYTNIELSAVAGELTKRYSKEFLLRLYLNQVYFGNQSYGVQAASRFYFGVDADELNLAQAALLAGLIEDPSVYDPVSNREVAFARQDEVFNAMGGRCLEIPSVGRHCVTAVIEGQPGYSQLVSDNVTVRIKDYPPRTQDTEFPHFVGLVRSQLEAAIPNIYSLGVEVRTTLVPNIQRRMELGIAAQVDRLSENGVITGAAVWADASTGAIRGYVGSHDFNDEENEGFNDYARIYRRPGQVILPVAYTAALRGVDTNNDGSYQFGEYYTPATVQWDISKVQPSPDNPQVSQQIPVWKGFLAGPTSLRIAMANGFNTPAVDAYNFVGNENYVAMGNALGGLFQRTDLQYNWLTAVGETPVRLVDLVETYTTFASGGLHRDLYVIDGIQDRNGTDIQLPESLQRTETRVLSESIAFLVQNILSDNNARDTRVIPRDSALILPDRPTQNFVAAQKGASTGNRDLWTVGFTQNAVVGVWLGRPDENQMQNVSALTSAAPVWRDIINTITIAQNPEPFRDPGNIERTQICTLTGTVFDQCGSPQSPELFASSRPAPTGNPFTATLAINTWTRERASAACPNPEDTVQETFATITDQAVVDYLRSPQGQPIARQLGLQPGFQQAPTETCNENSLLPSANISSPVNNQEVQGNIVIQGQVSAPANFNRYILEYAPAGQQNFIQIGSPSTAQQPAPGSQLGTWDTSGLANGTYDLRLSVIANDGGYVRRSVRVTISNPTPTPTPTIPPTPTAQILPTLDVIATDDGGLPFDPIPTPTVDPF